MEKYDVLKKILMIGDSGVGKTCLLLRYVKDEHRIDHLPTVGIDFKMKTVEVSGKKVKLQMWDTAGQERFITITNTFFKGAHGVFLCYSVTDERSFTNVKRWITQVKQLAPDDIVIFLLGNKTDLVHERQIQYEQGIKLADDLMVTFFEVSAFDGSNVEKAFLSMAEKILEVGSLKPGEDKDITIKNKSWVSKKKKKCCK